MHELSVSSAIVDTAVRHADGRKISVVSLRLGKLRQVVPNSLSFYFEIVGRDTVCEGARLELEMVDALMKCVSCAHEWDPAPQPEHGSVVGEELFLPQFRCPECQAAGAEVVRGDELEVESIEVEEITPARSSADASGLAGPLGAAGREDMNAEPTTLRS
ncbi:MAG: hydrogenase maturation nickel metallochaperone HypA [Solirubrobacterales bacterium]|nr:hydrogenase maturation nickel metallochaperone HypA [Solirubrobacterales bacterium]